MAIAISMCAIDFDHLLTAGTSKYSHLPVPCHPFLGITKDTSLFPVLLSSKPLSKLNWRGDEGQPIVILDQQET